MSAADKQELEEIRQARELTGTYFSWTVNGKGDKEVWEDRELGPNETIRVYSHSEYGRILLLGPSSKEPPSIEAALSLELEPRQHPICLQSHNEFMISTQTEDITFGPSSKIALVTDANTNVTYKALVPKSSTQGSSPITNKGSETGQESCAHIPQPVTTIGSMERPLSLGSRESGLTESARLRQRMRDRGKSSMGK